MAVKKESNVQVDCQMADHVIQINKGKKLAKMHALANTADTMHTIAKKVLLTRR